MRARSARRSEKLLLAVHVELAVYVPPMRDGGAFGDDQLALHARERVARPSTTSTSNSRGVSPRSNAMRRYASCSASGASPSPCASDPENDRGAGITCVMRPRAMSSTRRSIDPRSTTFVAQNSTMSANEVTTLTFTMPSGEPEATVSKSGVIVHPMATSAPAATPRQNAAGPRPQGSHQAEAPDSPAIP